MYRNKIQRCCSHCGETLDERDVAVTEYEEHTTEVHKDCLQNYQKDPEKSFLANY